MGTKAYNVSKPVGTFGQQGKGPIQVIIRADNPTQAAALGAAELGVSASAVKVEAFYTVGGVPGGDQGRYRDALDRHTRGEDIVDEGQD